MTDRPGDCTIMFTNHYEGGHLARTSTDTLPGRWRGSMYLPTPANAAAGLEEAREAFDQLLADLFPLLGNKRLLDLEAAANAIVACQWEVDVARVWAPLAVEMGSPSVVFVETDVDAPADAALALLVPETAQAIDPVLTRLRWRGRRVLCMMLAALAAGVLIGAAVTSRRRRR